MDPNFLAYLEPFDASKLPGPRGPDPVHRRALEAAVSGADAYRLTRAAVRVDGRTLRLGNRFVPVARYHEVAFVAVGRAAVSQALAAHHALGERLTQAYTIAPESTPPEVPFRDRVAASSGPGAAEAAELGAAVTELAGGLARGDLLLVLLSSGALGYLAAPPQGVGADAWRAELDRLHALGASGAEVAAIARVEASGPVGGRLGLATEAEVVTFVVDRGLGAAQLGGGPTVLVDEAERATSRAVLERVGAWAGLPAARRTPFLPDASRLKSRPAHVDRPVVVAEPADALREASAAVGEKRWLPRLVDLAGARPPEAAAERFVARAEELLRASDEDAATVDAVGLVAFATLTLDLPEGADEGPALDRFLAHAQQQVRRREMTVGAARTSGAPRAPSGGAASPRPAGGVVGARAPGERPTARPLPMRSGITDVGVLATAVLPRARSR